MDTDHSKKGVIDNYVMKAMKRLQEQSHKITTPVTKSVHKTLYCNLLEEHSDSCIKGNKKENIPCSAESYHKSHTERNEYYASNFIKEDTQPIVEKSVVTNYNTISQPINNTLLSLSIPQSLAISAFELKPDIIHDFANTIDPSQSLVNIMICYIAVLQSIECYNNDYKNIAGITKTYKNCVIALNKSEGIVRLTNKLVESLPDIKIEQAEKIINAKEKYLIGADMKIRLISDKYNSARKILSFLVELISYIEVIIN